MKKLLLSLFAVMLMLPLQAQLNEALHEGFEAGSFPTGWTQQYVRTPMSLGVDTADYSWTVESGAALKDPAGAALGSGRIAARNAGTDEMRFVTRLITPVMNIANGMFRPQLVFSHAEPVYAGYSDTLRVYYRTSATDIWHAYDQCVYVRNNNWRTETIDLIAPSKTYQLAFEISENMGHGVVLDEIIVRPTPTCRLVTDVQAINIHAFDATLVWNEEGYYNNFEVLIANTQLTDLTNIPDSAVVFRDNEVYNTELHIDSLEAETYYYVYVRSDCPENQSGYTDWTEGVFQTLSVAYLPYVQQFNRPDLFVGEANYGNAHGWITGSTRNVTSPFVSTIGSKADKAAFSVDSTAYLCFDAQHSAESTPLPNGAFAYAVAPEVMTDALSDVEVSFWGTAYDKVSDYAASLLVGVMTDPTDFSTFETVDSVSVDATYQHKRFNISLASYEGEGKFVALASRFGKQNAFYVDNLTIDTPAVATPSRLHVSKVHSTGFTVSADVPGAESWNVKVSTAYSRTGVVADSTVVYAQTGLTGSEHVVSVSDSLLADKIVMVYVQAVKNGAVSAWSFPVTVRVPGKIAVPYANSCDQAMGSLSLAQLNHEMRAPEQTASAAFYYPLSTIGSTLRYPTVETAKPNYKGAHVRVEGADTWFTLPELDSLTNLRMTFRYATVQGAKVKMEVGVMTDPYDLSTFEHVTSVSTSKTEYQRALVDLDAYQGEGKFVAFRLKDAGVSGVGSVLLLDEIQIAEWGACREAANIETSVSSTEATIRWADGGMSNWIVGLSTKRTMLNATYVTVDSASCTFSDLIPETQYYYTIQTVCDGEPLDLDNVYYEFKTPRGLPVVENFTSSSTPKDWSMATGRMNLVFNGSSLSSSSYAWSITSSHLYNPQKGYGASVNVDGTSCYKWLLSPAIALPEDVDELELSFDMALSAYSSYSSASTETGADDVFAVLFSLDGGNTWSRTNATVWSNDGQGDYTLSDLTWEQGHHIQVDASACIGQTAMFAFYAESTIDNEDYYITIDNISLHVVDPRCGGLSNLSVQVNNNTATLTWNLGGTNPYPALVQVAANASFTSLIANDTVADGSLQLSDLQLSTHYYVRARQLCPSNPDWVTKDFTTPCEAVTLEDFGTETFTDPAVMDCWVVGFGDSKGSTNLPERVNNERFGQVLSITKSSTDSTASDGAFAATPLLILPDSLSMRNYQVVFRAGAYGSDSKNVGRIKVGVTDDVSSADYATFDFVPLAELHLTNATDSLGLKTYVVSLEDYTDEGRYLMFYSEVGQDSTNFVYIDDVTFERASGCKMVLNLECDTTTEESALLKWTGTAAQYELLLTDSYCDPDTVTNAVYRAVVDTNRVWVEGLLSNTHYYAYIRSVCDTATVSRWSSATRLTTRFGIFFEPWDDKATFLASGWEQKNYQLTTAPFAASAMTAGNRWSLTATPSTTSTTVTGMFDKVVRANIYSTYGKDWIITPSIDLTGVESGAMLSFKLAVYPYGSGTAAAGSTDKRFAVLISENNGQNWTPANATIWACDGTGQYDFRQLSANAQKFNIDLSSYVGKKIKIGFYGESTGSSSDLYFALDSIGVARYVAECLGVRNLAFNLISGTEAKATWRHISTPALTDLELATDAGFENIIAQVNNLDTTAYTFTGLLPNMTYYLRASQTGCRVDPVVVHLSTPKSLPYEQKLNAMPDDWTLMKGNAVQAFHDTLPNLVTSSAWSVKNGHLYGELYKQATQTEYWIVTPDVVMNAGDEDIVLTFDLNITAHNKDTAYSVASKTDGQELRVLLSTDGGESWSESDQWLFANTADAYMRLSAIDTVTRISLDMNNYKNERVRVAFYKASTHATNDNDIHISNFRIGEVLLPCDMPTALKADSNSISFTEAHISWQTEAASSVVQVSKSENFAAVLSSDTVAATELQLQELESATEYFVRVKALCSEKSISDWTEAVSFKTAIGLPYSEPLSDRDNWTAYTELSGEAALLSPSFTNVSTSAKGWKKNTSTKQVGVAHIACQHDTSTFWFVSPEIDLTRNLNDTAIVLSLDLALTSTSTGTTAPSAANIAGKKFFIAVSTDNGKTWPAANRIEWSDAAGAQFKLAGIPCKTSDANRYENIPMTQYRGQKIRLALVLEGSTKKAFYVHAANLMLEAIGSTCFGVSNITVNHVDTAAVVGVTPLDEATQWEVAYGLAGTDLLAMPSVHSYNKDSVHLGGLQLNSIYDVYARSICSEGDTSAWYGPTKLVTPLGLNYSAPFAGALNDWKRYQGALTDTVVTDSLKSVTGGWQTTSSASILGVSHIYAIKSATETNWLVSPLINLMPDAGADGSIYLSLNMALTATSTSATAPTNVNGSTFTIAVSEDGGATWNRQNRIVFGDKTADQLYNAIPATGRAYHFDVTRYAGKEIRVALIMGSYATGASTIHVSDFELAHYDVPCFGVAALTATYEQGAARCVITPGDSATVWQYAYGLQGFTPSDANAYTTTADSFAITNLPMSSTIEIYARSICGAADTSAWSHPATIRTPLGIPYSESLNRTGFPTDWEEYTYSTTSKKFTSTTSTLWYVGASKNSYVWGTSHAYINAYSSRKEMLVTPAVDLGSVNGKAIVLNFDMALTKYGTSSAPTSVSGQSFEIRVSTDGGTTWGEPVAVWDESGMSEYTYSSIATTGTSYQVDLTEFGGEAIRVGFYSVSTGVSGVDNDLHIRNVTLDTLSGTFCAPISRVSVLEADFTSVKVAFRAPGINDALDIEYVCQPENEIFNAKLAQHSDTGVVVIKGLQSSMNYNVFARLTCKDSVQTEWTGPFVVQTAECTPVTGISYSLSDSLDVATITLKSDGAGSAKYQLTIAEKNGMIDEEHIEESKSKQFVISYPFEASTVYDVYVRKICVEGETPEWTGPFALKTPVILTGDVIWSDELSQSLSGTNWSHYTTSSATIPTPETAFSTTSSSWTVGSIRNNNAFGVDHAYVNNYSTYKRMLATPAVDLSSISTTGAVLAFDLALTSYSSAGAPTSVAGQRFEIRVSVDGGFTWVMQEAWAESGADHVYATIPTGQGETYQVNISEYVGQEVLIGFYAVSTVSGADNDLHLRNVRILGAGGSGGATCQKPDQMTVAQVGLTTANLSAATAINGYYQLATDSRFTNVVAADSINGTLLQLTNLDPSTTYYFRTKRICSDDDESIYSAVVKFTTSYGVRFYEDFEDAAVVGTKWQKKSGLISNVFTRGSSAFASATSSYGPWKHATDVRNMGTAHVRSNLYSTDCHEWLLSPQIDLTPNAGQSLLMAFDVATSTYGNGNTDAGNSTDDKFVVAVSTDNGKTWNASDAFVWDCDNKATSMNRQGNLNTDITKDPQRKVIDMSRFAGQHIVIAFYTESTQSGTDNYLYLDNVELNAAESFSYADTICSSAEYDNHGFSYAENSLTAGMHNLSRISAHMDSVVYLNLFVNESYRKQLSDTICEGEVYNENGYNFLASTSGLMRRRLVAGSGCDSLVLLNLTVLPVQRQIEERYACLGTSYELNGKSYYSNAIVKDTVPSATGCDSITTYYINFSDQSSYTTKLDVALCMGDSFLVGDSLLTRAGNYSIALASRGGCDSTVLVHLFAVDAKGYIYDTVAVDQLPYYFNDRQLAPEGTSMGVHEYVVTTECGTSAHLQLNVVSPAEGYDNIFSGKHTVYKRVIDNQLYIIIDDRWYDATGKVVKNR